MYESFPGEPTDPAGDAANAINRTIEDLEFYFAVLLAAEQARDVGFRPATLAMIENPEIPDTQE